jgi:hypothetical protein
MGPWIRVTVRCRAPPATDPARDDAAICGDAIGGERDPAETQAQDRAGGCRILVDPAHEPSVAEERLSRTTHHRRTESTTDFATDSADRNQRCHPAPKAVKVITGNTS